VTRDDLFDEDSVENFEDYLDDDVDGHISESEIGAGGGRTSVFSVAQIRLASDRLDIAGVLPKFAEWRAADAKYRGGRERFIDDRAIMVACMLLRVDESPMWITEMGNLFHYRLDDDGRRELGIAGVPDTGAVEVDRIRWFNRAWRAFHAVVDTMDPWPGSRLLLDREGRIAQMTLREKNNARAKQERIDWFSGAMLEMTFQIQPREIRREWRGALSVDQTAVRAPSQRGRSRHTPDTKIEVIHYNDDGTEKPVYVLEPDADRYPKKFSNKPREGDGTASQLEYEWSYMADIVVQAADNPGTRAKHPLLAMSVGLSKPNEDIGGTTVRAMKAIKARGHHVSRLTADLGYIGLGPVNYNVPMKEIGVPLVTDYKEYQKGVEGNVGGAVQVEGGHFCPGTPQNLLNASIDYDEGEIDRSTWSDRMTERQLYKVRAKERPDKDGHRPMMCPAIGPGATVECEFRDIHNRSSKKAKPAIMKSRLPKKPDRICTQSSVDFGPHDGVEHEQLIPYGTPEWQETYKHDRNSVESYNAYVKNGPESLDKPENRRVRGRAAQQFIVTMLLMSANIRKLARFLADERRATPKSRYARRRDVLGLSDYVRPDRQKKRDKAAAKRAKKAATPLRT